MLLEVFTVIALLCQVHGGTDPRVNELMQATCQDNYVRCIEAELSLERCVKLTAERKLGIDSGGNE